MNLGLTWPLLRAHGVGDLATVREQVVQRRRPAARLGDRVRCDQAGALPGLEMVMGDAEPIDAVVLHPNAEPLDHPVDIFVTSLRPQVLRPEEGRVADDGIGLGPLGAQRIGDPDAGQVDQRKDRLGLAEAVDHLPLPPAQRRACRSGL